MTLEEAIKILNEKHHHYATGWHIHNEEACVDCDIPDFTTKVLSPFEAVAIAEKYEREQVEKKVDEPKAITGITYSRLPPQTEDAYIGAIKWALGNERELQARQLANEGLSLFPDNKLFQNYARILAPPVVKPSRFPRGEAVEITHLGCAKCKDKPVTFEIMSMALEPYPGATATKDYTPIFSCECHCEGCRDYFMTRVTEAVVDVIANGGLQNWKISATGLRHFDEGMKQYRQNMRNVK